MSSEKVYWIPGAYSGPVCPKNPDSPFCNCPSPIYNSDRQQISAFDNLSKMNRIKLYPFEKNQTQSGYPSNDTPGFLVNRYEQPG